MRLEKTDTGFSAYSQNHPVFTTGTSISELMQNAYEATEYYFENLGINAVGFSKMRELIIHKIHYLHLQC